MKRFVFLLLSVLPLAGQAQRTYESPTEGVLTADFVPEATMKQDLLSAVRKRECLNSAAQR